jgi:hypothetical protein
MRLTTIKVPDGCKEIAVDVEDGKVIVSYGDTNGRKEFFCKETNCLEEEPGVGDFAIFWLDGDKEKAVVANLVVMERGRFYASNECCYTDAIKFRNYEQYIKVKGQYVEDEP